MRIVLAPDSFKGTLSAAEVCAIEEEAIRKVLPDAQLVSLPLADGGEGTLDVIALARPEAKRVVVNCHDPLGREITAEYLRLPDGTAIVELAQASGLQLLAPEERNPLKANTFGTGELILHALKNGCRKLIVGLGGSATVDGGLGLVAALAGSSIDKVKEMASQELDSIFFSNILNHIKGIGSELQVTIASDVTNPLLGPNGAAAVFGPQKGATPEMVEILEQRLRQWASLWHDDGNQPGDGAAGGGGFILRKLFPHCQTVSGGELVCELAALDKELADADLVITGEGTSDAQTLNGKLPLIVSQHARNANVPCALLSGYLSPTAKIAIKPHFHYLDGTLAMPPASPDLTHEACEKRLVQTIQHLVQTILDKS